MKWLLLGVGALALMAGWIWLALWADERNLRFYQATEPSRWQDTSWDWHG